MRHEPSDAEYENYYRQGYVYSHGFDPLDPDYEEEYEDDDDYWDRYDDYRNYREER